MEGAEEPSRAPKRLFTFNSREDINQFATGCDADVGGLSTVHFELDESTAKPSTSEKTATPHGITVNQPTGKFWGEMSLAVRRGLEGQIRGGYAGFRSKVRQVYSSMVLVTNLHCLASVYPLWRDDGRRFEPRVPRPACESTRSPKNTQLLLREPADGRTHHNGPVATPIVLQERRRWLGGCLCE